MFVSCFDSHLHCMCRKYTCPTCCAARWSCCCRGMSISSPSSPSSTPPWRSQTRSVTWRFANTSFFHFSLSGKISWWHVELPPCRLATWAVDVPPRFFCMELGSRQMTQEPIGMPIVFEGIGCVLPVLSFWFYSLRIVFLVALCWGCGVVHDVELRLATVERPVRWSLGFYFMC